MNDKEHDDFRSDFRNELNSRWTTEQLRELIESVNKERDRRYTDKFEQLEKLMLSGFAAAKEAVASALAAAKEAVTAAFESAKEAITKQETATEKRFESVNEFRSQLKDQQVTLLPRAEADQRFQQLRDLYDAQQKQIAAQQNIMSGREGGDSAAAKSRLQMNWNIGTIIAVIALAVGVINYLSKH